ncbi:MAG: hypothetical protein IBX70_11055 [Clostridia bacterium]|nr:hypothetical protein [Clostridia bacterium]
MEQVKTINSGIHIKYLRDYFSGIADHQSGDDYFCGQVLIRLLPLDDQVHGTIALPRTEIVFSGTADDVERQIYKYRMAFLSAGG